MLLHQTRIQRNGGGLWLKCGFDREIFRLSARHDSGLVFTFENRFALACAGTFVVGVAVLWRGGVVAWTLIANRFGWHVQQPSFVHALIEAVLLWLLLATGFCATHWPRWLRLGLVVLARCENSTR